jgi:hypothetical protein
LVPAQAQKPAVQWLGAALVNKNNHRLSARASTIFPLEEAEDRRTIVLAFELAVFNAALVETLSIAPRTKENLWPVLPSQC